MNVAVGFQRSLAISAKDLTTVDMISAKGMHLGPDSARIGGVGVGGNNKLDYFEQPQPIYCQSAGMAIFARFRALYPSSLRDFNVKRL